MIIRDAAPILGLVANPGNVVGGRKVYLVNPAWLTNDESEGAELTYDYESETLIPVTMLGNSTPQKNGLILGMPAGERVVGILAAPAPGTITVKGRVRLAWPWAVAQPWWPRYVVVAYAPTGAVPLVSDRVAGAHAKNAPAPWAGLASAWRTNPELNPDDPDDWLNWSGTVPQPGSYRIELHAAGHQPAVFDPVVLAAGDIHDCGDAYLTGNADWDSCNYNSFFRSFTYYNGSTEYHVPIHLSFQYGELDLVWVVGPGSFWGYVGDLDTVIGGNRWHFHFTLTGAVDSRTGFAQPQQFDLTMNGCRQVYDSLLANGMPNPDGPYWHCHTSAWPISGQNYFYDDIQGSLKSYVWDAAWIPRPLIANVSIPFNVNTGGDNPFAGNTVPVTLTAAWHGWPASMTYAAWNL
jgi:hypothetical protein